MCVCVCVCVSKLEILRWMASLYTATNWLYNLDLFQFSSVRPGYLSLSKPHLQTRVNWKGLASQISARVKAFGLWREELLLSSLHASSLDFILSTHIFSWFFFCCCFCFFSFSFTVFQVLDFFFLNQTWTSFWIAV